MALFAVASAPSVTYSIPVPSLRMNASVLSGLAANNGTLETFDTTGVDSAPAVDGSKLATPATNKSAIASATASALPNAVPFGVFQKVISSFKGDFAIVKPANLAATVGTLRIQVKN